MPVGRSDKTVRHLLRGALAVYFVALTLALLVKDPTAAVPDATLSFYDRIQPSIHAISFFMLGLLAFAAVPQKYRVLTFILLLIYGGATEALQGLVPGRAVELEDFIQNLGGLIAGAAVAWMAAQLALGLGLIRPPAAES